MAVGRQNPAVSAQKTEKKKRLGLLPASYFLIFGLKAPSRSRDEAPAKDEG